MIRVHFTMDNLARTRVVAVPTATAETFFAMDLYARRGGGVLFARWQTMVQSQLREASARRAIAQLVRTVRLSPGAFDPDHDGSSLSFVSPERRCHNNVIATMTTFQAVGVAPFWSRIQ